MENELEKVMRAEHPEVKVEKPRVDTSEQDAIIAAKQQEIASLQLQLDSINKDIADKTDGITKKKLDIEYMKTEAEYKMACGERDRPDILNKKLAEADKREQALAEKEQALIKREAVVKLKEGSQYAHDEKVRMAADLALKQARTIEAQYLNNYKESEKMASILIAYIHEDSKDYYVKNYEELPNKTLLDLASSINWLIKARGLKQDVN